MCGANDVQLPKGQTMKCAWLRVANEVPASQVQLEVGQLDLKQ